MSTRTHAKTHTTTSEDHRVRPRRVWAGLGLALLGAALVGLGVALTSWPWAIVGTVALGAGAVLGATGGGMYDVRAGSPAVEAKQVVRGEEYEGVAPGDMVEEPQVRRTSRELDHQREELIRRTHEAPRPPLATLGALVMLLVSVYLLFAQWELYPTGMTGQNNGLRALGVGVVAALAAFRVLLGPLGPHPLAGGLALLGGAWLLAQAFFFAHAVEATAASEAVCGVLVVLGAAATLLSPERPEPAAGAETRRGRAGG